MNAQNDELVCKGNCVSRTTGALTRTINHERMPVLLSGEDQFETWLSGPVEEAFALARSFDPGAMHVSRCLERPSSKRGLAVSR